MNITINEKILRKHSLTVSEFLVMYLCAKEVNIGSVIESLISRGIVEKDLTNPYSAVLSDNTKDLVASILIDSDKAVIDKDSEYTAVAEKLRNMYPEGKKPGTTYYWRDSTAMIAKKLKTLTVKYGFKFTEEQAINATQSYIDSFHGDYKFMELLKYFILKTDRISGECKSNFMSMIENEGQCDEESQDWLVELSNGNS